MYMYLHTVIQWKTSYWTAFVAGCGMSLYPFAELAHLTEAWADDTRCNLSPIVTLCIFRRSTQPQGSLQVAPTLISNGFRLALTLSPLDLGHRSQPRSATV